jgi:hypothetical protein
VCVLLRHFCFDLLIPLVDELVAHGGHAMWCTLSYQCAVAGTCRELSHDPRSPSEASLMLRSPLCNGTVTELAEAHTSACARVLSVCRASLLCVHCPFSLRPLFITAACHKVNALDSHDRVYHTAHLLGTRPVAIHNFDAQV